MKRYYDLGLLILRVAFGLLMLHHGFPKLMRFIGGEMTLVGDPIGLSGFITSILVLLAEVVDGHDPIQKKELALLYLAGFVAIALMGPGRFSVDRN
jgi:putative oxidoreductase